MEENELIKNIVNYIDKYVFQNHINSIKKKHSKIKSYSINPILVKYLSKVLDDEYTPEGVAKALFYPRVLGTSINTSFGTRIQKMFVELEIANGSLIKGMDIEFIDKIDNRKKWCQLKSGPNTINYEDVDPLIKKFSSTINLARTNSSLKGISNSDFVVGVLYGEIDELSMHYKEIDKKHPVIIGKEFWHRVTGYPDFYIGLVNELQVKINNLNTKDVIKNGYKTLCEEIKASNLFDFS